VLQRFRNAALLLWGALEVDPDIVVVSEPDACIVGLILRLVRGCRMIIDVREVYEERARAFPFWCSGFVRQSIRMVMRLCSSVAFEIIHVSPERQRRHSWLGRAGVVIFPYPDLTEYLLPSALDPAFSAVHAGALRPSYAGHELLAAWRLVAGSQPDARLLVIGGAVGGVAEDPLLAELVAGGSVVVTEHVGSGEIPALLQSAAMGLSLVLPYDVAHELAQPRKLYEYFAASLPAVVSDVPTLRRVVEGAAAGLVVDARDPRSIAAAVLDLLSSANRCREFGRRARHAAEEHYNWAQQGPHLSKVFGAATVR
jgi:glycosyltransferase involved in cell wall biosynthesis